MRMTTAAVAVATMLVWSGVAQAARPLRFEERIVGAVDGYASDLAVARMNGDRRPDVAVAVERGVTEPGGVQLALNGARGFVVQPFVQGGQTPYRIGVGDVDGDGDADAAVANSVSQDVTVFGNDGRGALSSTTTTSVPHLTRGIAVADLDGDRRADVATSSTDDPDGLTSAALRMLPGGSGPALTLPADDFFVPAETILAVDLDRDRRRDLVAVDQSGILTARRTAGAAFEPVRRVALVEDGPFDVAAADLDRDGRTDLATANIVGTRVAVVLRRPDGGFEPPRYVEVGGPSAQIAVADFDGDCRRDIAVSLLDAGQVAVIRGARGGGFQAPQRYAAGPVPLALEAADMDADGDADLVVGDRDSQELRLLVNRTG